MMCIHPEKPCPYRKWVCNDKGECWWNCQWNCPHNHPDSDCMVAEENWGCPFLCIYDALDPSSACPFKIELYKKLINDVNEAIKNNKPGVFIRDPRKKEW